MRTEKEINDKISELTNSFLVEEDTCFSLRDLKRIVKVLRWVLGKDWVNNQLPAKHGGKGEK